MSGRQLLSRGRSFLFTSIVVCVLMVTATGRAWAQEQQPQKTETTNADLQARVDALRARVDALEHSPTPAPLGAWVALGIVGGLFVVAWMLVSAQRERSRRHEAITNAIVKLADKASQSAANEELKNLIAELRTAVRTAKSLAAFERLLRFFQA